MTILTEDSDIFQTFERSRETIFAVAISTLRTKRIKDKEVGLGITIS